MTINKIIELGNGRKIVEFKNDYQSAYYNFQTEKYEWKDTFRLDKHTIELRIKNLKEQSIDVSVEESALFLLTD